MKGKKQLWWILPILLLLAGSAFFLFGGEEKEPETAMPVSETVAQEPEKAEETVSPVKEEKKPKETEKKEEASAEEKKEASAEKSAEEMTEASAEEKQETEKQTAPEETPEEIPEETPEQETHVCTVSICCETVLAHMEDVSDAAIGAVPSSGWMLGAVTVEFTPGETLFDVLRRVTQEYGIPLEYSQSVAYSSAYVEGIGGLYEFDVGSLSGWMYTVNGAFPKYGCSTTEVRDGDSICWLYSCDLGGDIGGSNF